MAPDLNSVPVSPRPGLTTAPSHSSTRQPSTPASRRASQVHHMSPPPLPLASPGGTLPASHASHMHAFPPLSPGLSSGADAAHAPMRHPRPLTAAELHLELEKEQEAVVNRLTRELSNLRAHSASVASTVSSVASGAGGVGDAELAGSAGVYPPTSSSTSTAAAAAAAAARRERRSSSSVSRYSFGIPVPVPPTNTSASASSGQNRSQRHSVSSQQGQSQNSGHHGAEMRRSSSIVSTPRYEEVAQQQAALEEVKRENEVLKERIRELERAIRGREGDGERGRRGAPEG